MKKVTYEEACALSSSIATADNFIHDGVEKTMERHRQALADVGWTITELCDEAGRRMRERVKQLQAEEEAERCRLMKETPT